MKSFEEIDVKTCRSVAGIVFDIDDTVTRDGIVEADAYQAMHDLKHAGFKLIAVTGRPIGWVEVLTRFWPLDAAVGENGAGWLWRHGGTIYEAYFADESTRRGHRVVLDRIRSRVAREMPHIRETNDRRARRCDLAFDIGEHVRVDASDIAALVALIEQEGAHSSVSSVHAHAAPGPWDKAQGTIRAARAAFGIDLRHDRDGWMFVGDSGNDAAAFDFFPLSVGVRNVAEYLDRLLTPPAYITTADRGRGFSQLVRHVLSARHGPPTR